MQLKIVLCNGYENHASPPKKGSQQRKFGDDNMKYSMHNKNIKARDVSVGQAIYTMILPLAQNILHSS